MLTLTPEALLAKATLTSCQTGALDVLSRQGNVFLTGAAGTGKSYLLDQYLRDKPSDMFPIVASTGAAAVLIGGRTFHSFFGLGILEGGVEAAVQRALKSRKLLARLNAASCVVIDEVSMLSGTVLQAAETVSRRARQSMLPWGGLRIVVVGDFAQLPPVTPGGMQKDWAFQHPVWRESAFQPALLSTVMRTRDADFLDILNFVRAGIVNDDVRSFLDARTFDASYDVEGTRLYPHRAKADEYNIRRLHEIRGVLRSFHTDYSGDERVLESAKRAMPIPEILQLKEGALVMMRKNDVSLERLYVNGSLGTVTNITDDVLSVSLMSGENIEVEKQKFSYLDGSGTEVMSAWNFPVTLAWATTIHKAQGASLDKMIVDLSSLWEPGQAYVALSRVRSANGLFIERWNPGSIRAEPLVTSFYDSMAEEMKTYVPRPFFTVTRIETPATEEEAPRKKGKSRVQRATIIRTMLGHKASLQQMSVACGVKPDRILLYLEQFLEEGESLQLSYLTRDIPEISSIREAFEEHGTLRLRPAYDALEERIDFTTLRLVRCAIIAENPS
jgi:ATP-dependent DNA helicase PIF1